MTRSNRAPLPLLQQRRAAARRLRTWARIRTAARERMATALGAIDNRATDEANEPAVRAYLRAGQLATWCQHRLSAALRRDQATEVALLAALQRG